MGIGANSGYKHEPRNSGRSGLPRYILRPPYVDGFEGHSTLFDIGRDRIDHGVGSDEGGGDGSRVAHAGAAESDPGQVKCTGRAMPVIRAADAVAPVKARR